MQKRKLLVLSLTFCLSLGLLGCGTEFPQLSEEEYNQTVEYAAGLLMKYSINNQGRLVYISDTDKKKIKKEQEEELLVSEAPPVEEEQDIFIPEPEPEETSFDEEMEEVPDEEPINPDEDIQEEDSGDIEGGEDMSGASTLSYDNPQEIEPDLFLSYEGYSVSSSYPESSKSYVVSADKGKKLLVLRFDLYNASGSEMQVNMIPHKLQYQVILNGKNIGYSSVTFLTNDLASYKGTIDSKAHEGTVVVIQIDESASTNIETLGLIVTENGNSQTVNLK